MRVYMRQSKQSEVVARRPRTAHDMEVLSAFAEEVNAFLRANDRECMEMPECIMQRPSPLQRTPSRLDPRDKRFEKRDQRIFVCDGCGTVVTRSSVARGTAYSRLQCEFAGGWVNQSWKQIPGKFQERAWELGLIDATWHCLQFCGQEPTGWMSSSIQRAQAWRKTQWAQQYPRHDR